MSEDFMLKTMETEAITLAQLWQKYTFPEQERTFVIPSATLKKFGAREVTVTVTLKVDTVSNDQG
jgi:hypothetical protein